MFLARNVNHFNVVYNISSLELSTSIFSILRNKNNKNNNNKNKKSKSLVLKKNFTLAKLDFFTENLKKIKD